MMHAAVGTALGGVCTMVGEPRILLSQLNLAGNLQSSLAHVASQYSRVDNRLNHGRCARKTAWFGYGWQLPESVRNILVQDAIEQDAKRDRKANMALIVQAIVAVWLVVGLALHLAEVGIIGLSVIVLTTAFNGVTNEHALGGSLRRSFTFASLVCGIFCNCGGN